MNLQKRLSFPCTCLLRLILVSACTHIAASARADADKKPIQVFLELETAIVQGIPNPQKEKLEPNPFVKPWHIQELSGSSGGQVLNFWGRVRRAAPDYESDGAPLTVPAPGAYRVWIRFHKNENEPSALNLYAVLRDEQGRVLGFTFLDWVPQLPTDAPYDPAVTGRGLRYRPGVGDGRTGFIWESFDLAFARPVAASLHIGFLTNDHFRRDRHLDCVFMTTDKTFDPASVDIAELPARATHPAAPHDLPALSTPRRFVPSVGFPSHVDGFSSIADPAKRFEAWAINCASDFLDPTFLVRLGFSGDHNTYPNSQGISSCTTVGFPRITLDSRRHREFAEEHGDAARFLNSEGRVSHLFSLHYAPWVAFMEEQLEHAVRKALDEDAGDLHHWVIALEEGGWLDYNPLAIAAFRTWLREKHGDIETLNKRWGSDYGDFSDISPARRIEESRASFFEFRDFSGNSYARMVGRQLPIIRKLDPKNRPLRGANANVDIDMPYMMAYRTVDYDELWRIGYTGEQTHSYDGYAADDALSNHLEFFTSIAANRKVVTQEWGVHGVDPRIAARSYWLQVAKGLRGIHIYAMQQRQDMGGLSLPKWALLSENGTPKDKLAAFSSAAQEVRRIEPLLMAADYTHPVKPVALYWSRIDIGLDAPSGSLYGQSLNDPVHIYRSLRGAGYPVRYVTPRQIVEGDLDRIGALVMAGVNHVPESAARAIAGWVEKGGAVIADSWPGAFNEYGQPQDILAPLFGARPVIRKAGEAGDSNQGQMALQESSQGYGDVTDAAVLRVNIHEKIDEIAQQPGATHPVAKATGDFMVSGIIPEQVAFVSGRSVGMTHVGQPGFIINEYGQGHTLYSSMLLGTIYEGSASRAEWDAAFTGLSFPRLLDAFLQFAGVEPSCRISGLSPKAQSFLRIESPLVTPAGNVLIGLVSFLPDEARPFDLDVALPGAVGPFSKVLVLRDGCRELHEVDHVVGDGRLKIPMPSFDSYAMILALKDSAPLVSLELQDVVRGDASLAVIPAGARFQIKVVVHNPSQKPLRAGSVAMTLPLGWFQSSLELPARRFRRSIPPGGSAAVTFRIQAPEIAPSLTLEPIQARFRNEDTTSTPATEMVWWGE